MTVPCLRLYSARSLAYARLYSAPFASPFHGYIIYYIIYYISHIIIPSAQGGPPYSTGKPNIYIINIYHKYISYCIILYIMYITCCLSATSIAGSVSTCVGCDSSSPGAVGDFHFCFYCADVCACAYVCICRK